MARIRYLKPDFFKDEDIAELPHNIRIFYAGLWCYADRAGRLEDRPKRLKAEIYPYEDFDVESALNQLSLPKKSNHKPFIVRYQKDGCSYIQILQWDKHQKPHPTEKKSEIPPPNNSDLTVKERLEQSGEGNGDGEGNGEKRQASPALKAALDKIYKDINIYALMNKLKKQLKWPASQQFPEEVLLKVCATYDKGQVKDEWAWFTIAIKKASAEYFAEQNIKQNAEFKKAPMAQSIKDILGLTQ